jgi:hypothetical protein
LPLRQYKKRDIKVLVISIRKYFDKLAVAFILVLAVMLQRHPTTLNFPTFSLKKKFENKFAKPNSCTYICNRLVSLIQTDKCEEIFFKLLQTQQDEPLSS